MNKPQNLQAGPLELAALKIAPAAFTAALTAAIPPGKIGWTSDNHWDLLESLFPSLKDESGIAATIDTKLENILKLIYQPKEEVEKAVLRQAFADAGHMLDEATEGIFFMMFSTAQFADFLAKTKNPATGQPFIQKDKKRGAKKDTFASLITAVAPPPVIPQIDQTQDPSTPAEQDESGDQRDNEDTPQATGDEPPTEQTAPPAKPANGKLKAK